MILLIPIVDKAVEGRPSRVLPGDPPAGLDHQGQRADRGRLHHVLQGGRPADDAWSRSANFAGAAQALAATTLRAVIGDIPLDDVLAKRDEINQILRAKLDEVTERWGVKVTNVEIREIIPPPAVQEAMTRQMSAERTRRAVVTEAEGAKQAAITVAEGNKERRS